VANSDPDTSTNGQAVALQGTSITELPEGFDPVELTAVSCPDSDVCIAADSAGRVLTYTRSTGQWSMPVPAVVDNGTSQSAHDAAGQRIHGLSCSSVSFCVAVTDTFAISEVNGVWGDPAYIGYNTNVSCPSPAACYAGLTSSTSDGSAGVGTYTRTGASGTGGGGGTGSGGGGTGGGAGTPGGGGISGGGGSSGVGGGTIGGVVAGTASVSGPSGRVSRNAAEVTITCANAGQCSGSVEIDAFGAQAARKKSRRASRAVVARGRYTIAAGKRGSVKIPLTSRGKILLRTHHGALRTKLTLRPISGRQVSQPLTLKQAKTRSPGKR